MIAAGVTAHHVATAERIVDIAGQAGGIDEVRRLAEFGWPDGRELDDDSPELRAAIQSVAWCVVESANDEAP